MEFLKNSVSTIRNITDFEPEILIVLGSGLHSLVDRIDKVAEVSFGDIEGFPVATNKAHEGCFVFGYLEGKKVVAMNGRIHYYEGYPMQDVVAPLRVCYMLGADKAIITNAAGAINPSFDIGDFMLVKDCLSVLVQC